MTATEIPLADRLIPVTMILADGPVTVTGERTECPYLAITPAFGADGISDVLVLRHIPTGRNLGRMLLSRKSQLRELAAAVAHLDWDFSDPSDLPEATRTGFREAQKRIEFEQGERIVRNYPAGWETDPHRIPGLADPMFAWLLAGYEAVSDRVYPLGGTAEIPCELDNGEINPKWIYATMRLSDTFAHLYLLAALRRVAPQVADHAAAWLAGTLEDGESIGEWAHRWREQLDAGEPLTLPAVPSPEPADGEFLS